jgi:hypothetical protein
MARMLGMQEGEERKHHQSLANLVSMLWRSGER